MFNILETRTGTLPRERLFSPRVTITSTSMSSSHANPDHHGAFSNENVPPVFVRAGKAFACTSCGTLVEIPADVVGKLAWRGEQTTLDLLNIKPPITISAANPDPPDEQPASSQHADAQTSRQQAPSSTSTTTDKPRPARPDRPKQPPRPTFAGRHVDGLIVPSGQQLDYALKWVSFHLKVLDRQTGEIKRLQKLIKQQTREQAPCSRPRGEANSKPVPEPVEAGKPTEPSQAQADLGVAPNRDNETERGPP
ncbi:hypothetical protein C5Y96_03285 [Blastopirellula marina]|uniref:Uncharacterized protein n=1 Tax=Blastopirellula marina TaxID=124 RepID=A0A2S8G379_9BACT|nr:MULTISPECIES: hypothetical protein [Pirellulaceae]PQO38908.1 hypothetical protein C5Y96_03285 [Blastopirellula marina]RCS55216.1 hypothetical protein DTL36_03290 [Bremerella cremea]